MNLFRFRLKNDDESNNENKIHECIKIELIDHFELLLLLYKCMYLNMLRNDLSKLLPVFADNVLYLKFEFLF